MSPTSLYQIINAGIAGQSTYGHIYNFQHWFPKLKDFSPKLYIFYIGINDQWLKQHDIDNPDINSGAVKNPEILTSFVKIGFSIDLGTEPKAAWCKT